MSTASIGKPGALPESERRAVASDDRERGGKEASGEAVADGQDVAKKLGEEVVSATPSAAPSVATAVAPAPGVRAEAPLSPVERLTVKVDFEVGRATVPVAELANIGSGSVLVASGIERSRILAKSGGQPFAVGEFVEIGGRVGFRITELLSTAESAEHNREK